MAFSLQISFILLMLMIPSLWYGLVALSFSLSNIRATYSRFKRWIDISFGALLIVVGVKIAVSER